MTNFEFYKEEILNLINSGRVVAKVNGKIVSCGATKCSDCDFGGNCERNRFTWLYAEHIEKPTLNRYERGFCKALRTGWLARDKDDAVYWHKKKPAKDFRDDSWFVEKSAAFHLRSSVSYANPEICFHFIKWEDDEPWSVEELLKLEVRE